MRIPYKRVGDTFSLDEYNALVYLITHEGLFTETIPLEFGKTYNGMLADYQFRDPNGVLVEDKDGYTIKKLKKDDGTDNCFFLDVNHKRFKDTFSVMFDVYRNNHTLQEVTEGEDSGSYIDVNASKKEFLDVYPTTNDIYTVTPPMIQPLQLNPTVNQTEVDNDNSTPRLRNQKFSSEQVNETYSVIKIVPAEYYKNNDWISRNVTIKLSFPLNVNYEDGESTESKYIICKTMSDIKRAIETTPTNGTTYLRLEGKTYKWDKEIVLTDEHIEIIGGNIDLTTDNNKPFTILDAESNNRFFSVREEATLVCKNINFKNGSAYGTNNTYTSAQRGGAIHIANSTYYTNGNISYHKPQAIFYNCWFTNNLARYGGALFNGRGKLVCENCFFRGNKAKTVYDEALDGNIEPEYRQWNWGGAIRSETITGTYHSEQSDRMYLKFSTITKEGQWYYFNINFSKSQNSNILERTLSKNNLKVYNDTTHTEIPVESVSQTTDYEDDTRTFVIKCSTSCNLKYNHQLSLVFVDKNDKLNNLPSNMLRHKCTPDNIDVLIPNFISETIGINWLYPSFGDSDVTITMQFTTVTNVAILCDAPFTTTNLYLRNISTDKIINVTSITRSKNSLTEYKLVMDKNLLKLNNMYQFEFMGKKQTSSDKTKYGRQDFVPETSGGIYKKSQPFKYTQITKDNKVSHQLTVMR